MKKIKRFFRYFLEGFGSITLMPRLPKEKEALENYWEQIDTYLIEAFNSVKKQKEKK